jgi:putative membrane protein
MSISKSIMFISWNRFTKLSFIFVFVILPQITSFKIPKHSKFNIDILGIRRFLLPYKFGDYPTSSIALNALKRHPRYSSASWKESLLTLPSSRILARIRSFILFIVAWTTGLTILYKLKILRLFLAGTVHAILGSALSLLLVFRTNSSYDKFWEGRKNWGAIILGSRDFARNTLIHIHPSCHEHIGKLLVAFAISLKQHLHGDDIISELEPYIDDKEGLKSVADCKNRPFRILSILHKLVFEKVLEKYEPMCAIPHQSSFERSIEHMGASVTACERIVNQPIPLIYYRHTSRFLTLYLMTLPMALVQSLGWLVIPVMAFVSWSFVSIQGNRWVFFNFSNYNLRRIMSPHSIATFVRMTLISVSLLSELSLVIEDPFVKENVLISLGNFINIISTDTEGIYCEIIGLFMV